MLLLHKVGLFLFGLGAAILLASVGLVIRLAVDWVTEGIWFDGALAFLGLAILFSVALLAGGIFVAKKFESSPTSK